MDKKCAPSKTYKDGSCFSLKSLKKIAENYNLKNPNNKINITDNKSELVKHLEQKLNKLEEVPSKELVEVKLEEEPEEEESHDDVLEEKQEDQPDKEEYKKMSLNKLKALVLEKKLTSDVSKLKKNDLLTILGIEV